MRVEFTIEYEVSPNVVTKTEVDADINSDKDKRTTLQAIADILGLRIEIDKTYAEKVFEGEQDETE